MLATVLTFLRDTNLVRFRRCVLSIVLGGLCLVAVLAVLGGATQAAPSGTTGTDAIYTFAAPVTATMETVAPMGSVPESEVTWAPEYRNTNPITMTWEATAVAPPPGKLLTEVRLWYSSTVEAWRSTDVFTVPNTITATGVFTFEPAGDDIYHFATVAKTGTGTEADPTGEGDATTVYDTIISPVIGLTAMPAGWTNTNAFTLTWDNPADLSGIAGAWYLVEGSLGGPTLTVGSGITTLAGLTVPQQGRSTVEVWLVDHAGNVDYTTAATTALRYDTTKPNVVITAPSYISVTTFAVEWNGADALSGVRWYDLQHRVGNGPWQPWLTHTTQVSETFTASETQAFYTFVVTATDQAGNQRSAAKVVAVGPFAVYLPLVVRNYAPLVNGDFETGDLAGWNSGQGPFQGHGSGLPQTVIAGEGWQGSQGACLGDPSAVDELPVGYGYIAQTFTVDERYLQIRYHVTTYDIVKGAELGRYYDTFEVSLNTPPQQIGDSERDNKGCATTALNPTGTLTPTGGLAFCGGRAGSSDDAGTFCDLGWRTATLDLQDFQGNLTFYFALWSREYEPEFYDDQGLYNTWVCFDDIRFVDSPVSGGTGEECPSGNAMSSAPTRR